MSSGLMIQANNMEAEALKKAIDAGVFDAPKAGDAWNGKADRRKTFMKQFQTAMADVNAMRANAGVMANDEAKQGKEGAGEGKECKCGSKGEEGGGSQAGAQQNKPASKPAPLGYALNAFNSQNPEEEQQQG